MANCINKTFKTYIESFYRSMPKKGYHRYKSWEYCYKFFYNNRKEIEQNNEDVIDLASLHLSFYLASWGMYRGSSFLLQTDYTVHNKAVTIIAKYFDLCNIKKWDEKSTKKLFKLVELLNNYYTKIRTDVKNQEDTKETDKADISKTLMTKILLGTLGITPAYDRYFTDGLKLYKRVTNNKSLSATFNEKGFNKLIEFCQNYEKELNKLDLRLKIDKTIKYPLMKKIDMYFWNLGRPWAIEDNEGWKIGSKTVDYGNQYINYLQGETPNCFEKYIIDSNNPKKG